MADIVHFQPKATSGAKENTQDFVELCRQELSIFGVDLDWQADVWDVSNNVTHRGRTGRATISWTNHDTSKTNATAATMAQPFLDFGRAYIRYQQALKPTQSIDGRLMAIRALERALSENYDAPDIVNSDASVFNRASNLIKNKYASNTAYRGGAQLEMLSRFVNDNGFVPVRFSWKNPLKRDNDRNRVGKQFNEDRADKLPPPGAIDALAKAFHLAVDPPDIVIASVGALLMTAPNRINEVFRLPIACEVERNQTDNDSAYGLRWWPSKGAEPYVKWIGKTMVDVAKEAISNIRRETDHARSVAAWYEANPGRMWLPQESEHLRTETISLVADFLPVLGVKNDAGVNQWMKQNRVPVERINNKNCVKFSDVEKAIIKLLPDGFPVFDSETGLTYGDALFVVPKNFFHLQRGNIPCLIEAVSTAHINNGLGAALQHGKSSVFTRLDLTDDEGNDVKITTHQFRHWLNTIAQRGGLSQLDIAKWSGRKDIHQNDAYDHVSADEMLMMVRDLGETNLIGPLAEIVEMMPVSKEDFLEMTFPTAHTTEYGFCVHDYAMMPCQRHRDCVNCTEHVCIKGDLGKTARIRESLEITKDQIAQAKIALGNNTVGAGRWVEHHTKTAERLQGLVDILDDPSVPAGSVIQLAIPTEYSPIAIATDDRKSVGDRDAKILSDLRNLIGEGS